VLTGSPDINGGTMIGELGLCIIESRSGDGDRLLTAGGRVVARILVIVSGGYNDGDTGVVKLMVKSLVSGVAATFRSEHNPLTAFSMLSEPPLPPRLIEATEDKPESCACLATQFMPAILWFGDADQSPTVTKKGGDEALHIGSIASAAVTQNLHSDDFGGFGNTVWARNGGSSTMSPVAISVGVIVSAECLPPRGTPSKGGVINVDTSVCWIQQLS